MNTSSALRALSTPGASLLMIKCFMGGSLAFVGARWCVLAMLTRQVR